MVERERCRAVCVEVPPTTQSIEWADENLERVRNCLVLETLYSYILTASGELDCCELLLIVFLECRFLLLQKIRLITREGLDVCVQSS